MESRKRNLLEHIAIRNGYDIETFIKQFDNIPEYDKADNEIVINDSNDYGLESCDELLKTIARMDVDMYGRKLNIPNTMSVRVECRGTETSGIHKFYTSSRYTFDKSYGEKMVELLESQKENLDIIQLTECVKQYIDENF